MSSGSRSDGDSSVEFEELLQIGTRCRELRKEKDMLRESQSHSFELIKRLELHVKSLSEARTEDKKHIQKLQRELSNCSQEIDYLQDQLNARNTELHSMGEHVHELELKLADMEYLQEIVGQLREELVRSDSERLILIQELESKDQELQRSASCIEKLEESISTLSLDSQCEIEGMKLDILALEQACLEIKQVKHDPCQEKAGLIKELETQVHDAEEIIKSLRKENEELRQKLVTSERSGTLFLQKIEKWLGSQDRSQVNVQSLAYDLESEPYITREMREVLVLFFSKLPTKLAPHSNSKDRIDSMLHQISDYEELVKQLKEELREQKLKAKEEAEDLAQEMAELRYQMTSLLEEECKRRACIEQVSLQRIAELEAQVQREQMRDCALGEA